MNLKGKCKWNAISLCKLINVKILFDIIEIRHSRIFTGIGKLKLEKKAITIFTRGILARERAV